MKGGSGSRELGGQRVQPGLKNASARVNVEPCGGRERLVAAAASSAACGRLGIVLVGLLEGRGAVRPVAVREPERKERHERDTRDSKGERRGRCQGN